ncbi:MAG: hypothetical protein WCI30_08700 [Clostridia bacterium]
MKVIIKYFGPWNSITDKNEQMLDVPDEFSVGDAVLHLIELYGRDFANSINHNSVYIKNAKNEYIVANHTDILFDAATILFLGPVEGG